MISIAVPSCVVAVDSFVSRTVWLYPEEELMLVNVVAVVVSLLRRGGVSIELLIDSGCLGVV